MPTPIFDDIKIGDAITALRQTRLPQNTRITISVIEEPTFDHQTEPTETAPKGKWAQVADRLAEENFLAGEVGEYLEKSVRDFRNNFEMRTPKLD